MAEGEEKLIAAAELYLKARLGYAWLNKVYNPNAKRSVYGMAYDTRLMKRIERISDELSAVLDSGDPNPDLVVEKAMKMHEDDAIMDRVSQELFEFKDAKSDPTAMLFGALRDMCDKKKK